MGKYEKNETMRLLGKQSIYLMAMSDGIAREDYDNVLNVYREQRGGIDLYDIAIDFFMLGVIYGKREERAKKKGKKEGTTKRA